MSDIDHGERARSAGFRARANEQVIWTGTRSRPRGYLLQLSAALLGAIGAAYSAARVAVRAELANTSLGMIAVFALVFATTLGLGVFAVRTEWKRTLFVLTSQRVAVAYRHPIAPYAWLLTRSLPLGDVTAPKLDVRDGHDDIIWLGSVQRGFQFWFDWLGFPSWPHPPEESAFFLVSEDSEHVLNLIIGAIETDSRKTHARPHEGVSQPLATPRSTS